MWRGLRSLSPLVLGCSDGGGDAGTLPDHPWSLRPVDPGEAQQACLGDLLDADNFSKPLLLLVPLPGFCSHTHFPPTCASHFTWSVELSFSSPDRVSNFCFCYSPDTTTHPTTNSNTYSEKKGKTFSSKAGGRIPLWLSVGQHGAKNPPIPAYTCCSSHQEGASTVPPLESGLVLELVSINRMCWK